MILYTKKHKIPFEIDNDDFNSIKNYTWCCNNGYIITFINRKRVSLHRMLLKPKHNKVVDHIDGNKLNNKKSNLRICNQKDNVRNRRINTNNSCGLKGVYYNIQNKKYRAQIRINKISKHLGYFDCKYAAYTSYCEAASKYFKEYAKFE